MPLSTGGGVLSTIAVHLVRLVPSGGPGFVPFLSLADAFRLRLGGGYQRNKERRAAPMGWPGTPLLAGYRDGGQSTKYDRTCLISVRSFRPPLLAPTSPTKTQAAVAGETLAQVAALGERYLSTSAGEEVPQALPAGQVAFAEAFLGPRHLRL